MSQATVTERTSEARPSPGLSTLGAARVAPALTKRESVQKSGRREAVRKILLSCGVLSSIVYIGADVYAWTQYPGYSPVDQDFSELLAEGAPTRAFLLMIDSAPYNLLVAALGLAILVWPAPKRVWHITGAMLMLYALFSFLGGTVFEMDVRGAEPTARGALHPIVTAVQIVFMLLSIGFGAFMHGPRFRAYSIGTLATVLVFAGLSFLYVPAIAANQPTPWAGVVERVSIYAWMAWVVALAISVWRRQPTRPAGQLADGAA